MHLLLPVEMKPIHKLFDEKKYSIFHITDYRIYVCPYIFFGYFYKSLFSLYFVAIIQYFSKESH